MQNKRSRLPHKPSQLLNSRDDISQIQGKKGKSEGKVEEKAEGKVERNETEMETAFAMFPSSITLPITKFMPQISSLSL